MARSTKNTNKSKLSSAPIVDDDKLLGANDLEENISLQDIEETPIDQNQDNVVLDLEETTISKTFGRSEDVIELHIYSLSNQLLASDYDFEEYEFPAGNESQTTSELLIDYGPAYWASEVDNKTFKEKIESCGKNKRKPLETYWNFVSGISPF